MWVDSNVTKSTQALGTIFWWIFFALLVRLLWRLLDWSHNWFVATDKRLLLRYGLISHKVAMMPLLKVTDMSYVRSIPGQFLGYGKFVLESAGQDQALREVKWVPNPDQTYRDICARSSTSCRPGAPTTSRRSSGISPTIHAVRAAPPRQRARPRPAGARHTPTCTAPTTPSRTASTPTPGACRSSVRPTGPRRSTRATTSGVAGAAPTPARSGRAPTTDAGSDRRCPHGARRRSPTPLVCDDPHVPDPLGGQHERVPYQVGRGLDGRVRGGRPQTEETLSALDLTVFGIGVIIGAGIFTLTGRAAKDYAGPSIALSFVIGAIVCGLAALCYAEFASTVPVSGSAYTFSYATLGELIAWIIGWDLLLELMLGASVVAQGWSQYFVTFLGQMGVTWPESVGPGSHFDLPAFLLIAGLTLLIAWGIKESLRVNLVLVGVKLFIVLFVIFAGIQFINRDNWSPFIPPSQPGKAAEGLTTPLLQVITGMTPATYGVMGIMAGAAIVFFAYIGFDVVATTAEEAKKPTARPPPRDPRLPRHLHPALRRRHARHHRHAELQEHRSRCGARHGVQGRGQGGLRHAHLGRRRRRSHHGGHDPHHRRHPA